MKYELTESEFITLLDTVRSVVTTLAETSLAHAKLRQRTKLHESVGDAVADALDEFVDGSGDDDSDGADDVDIEEEKPEATVTPFRVVPPFPVEPIAAPTPEEVKREEQRAKALHGKDLWIALVELWRTNFGIEDAPQPDRVPNLHAATNPYVFAYLRSKAGLTDATREAIYLLDGGDPDVAVKELTKAQLREARLIAENIAAVSSFHAPDISELLEYTYEFRTLPKED